jgi:hypothetical protein
MTHFETQSWHGVRFVTTRGRCFEWHAIRPPLQRSSCAGARIRRGFYARTAFLSVGLVDLFWEGNDSYPDSNLSRTCILFSFWDNWGCRVENLERIVGCRIIIKVVDLLVEWHVNKELLLLSRKLPCVWDRLLPPGMRSMFISSEVFLSKAIPVTGVEASRFMRCRSSHIFYTIDSQMAVRLWALRSGWLYPPPRGKFLILIYVRDSLNPRAIVRLRELGKLKTKFNDLIGNGTHDPTCSIVFFFNPFFICKLYMYIQQMVEH